MHIVGASCKLVVFLVNFIPWLCCHTHGAAAQELQVQHLKVVFVEFLVDNKSTGCRPAQLCYSLFMALATSELIQAMTAIGPGKVSAIFCLTTFTVSVSSSSVNSQP